MNNRYIRVWIRDKEKRRKKVFMHRLIMEEHLGKKLSFNEIVHHKNGKPRDNRLENLEVLSRSKHAKLEHTLPAIPPNKKIPPNNNLSWCSGCQDFLSRERFTKNDSKWDGLGSFCRKCKREYDRDRYYKNKKLKCWLR